MYIVVVQSKPYIDNCDPDHASSLQYYDISIFDFFKICRSYDVCVLIVGITNRIPTLRTKLGVRSLS